jgi:hypothetical protein
VVGLAGSDLTLRRSVEQGVDALMIRSQMTEEAWKDPSRVSYLLAGVFEGGGAKGIVHAEALKPSLVEAVGSTPSRARPQDPCRRRSSRPDCSPVTLRRTQSQVSVPS